MGLKGTEDMRDLADRIRRTNARIRETTAQLTACLCHTCGLLRYSAYPDHECFDCKDSRWLREEADEYFWLSH